MRKTIDERQISHLIHFTQLSNLASILKHGIIPRRNAGHLDVEYNDEHRIDGHTDASCCSVSFPNYKMFWKHRSNDLSVDWVVLGLSPDILLEKKCSFYRTNAASNSIRYLSPSSLRDKTAFDSMFADIDGRPTRAEMKLRDGWTTDPQAEILVFDCIDVGYITAIGTLSRKLAASLTSIHPGFSFQCVPSFFKYRDDYQYWQD
ncbi:DarT ssDNA thymidine ADP-ribosyltransferase family protein [Sulfitobacter litoralis]|uniref:DarT ssDNA thymidine ADP-ribosyltransferase family protein n=1 Tax=Sulfitobacter litoralis TaxID=335975 RepID=UPI002B26B3E2|nr:DarT ssDNA thymidine ADP-ribosyltransferase family protein [Sulfitobacter litoralis]